MSATPPPPPPPPYGGDQPPPYGSAPGYGPPGYGPPGYGPPAYGAPGYGPPGYGPPTTRTNGMAIASLVIGILSFPLCWLFFVPSILAIIFGGVGIAQCNRDSTYSGKGQAIAGLILGVTSLALFLLLFAWSRSLNPETWDLGE